MNIEHKKPYRKYQLYLVHSIRVNGKVKKIPNKYLCSIPKSQIEGADFEDLGNMYYEDIKDIIQRKIDELQPHERSVIEKELHKLPNLIIDKLLELSAIQSSEEM
jgi:hypothetical protein